MFISVVSSNNVASENYLGIYAISDNVNAENIYNCIIKAVEDYELDWKRLMGQHT